MRQCCFVQQTFKLFRNILVFMVSLLFVCKGSVYDENLFQVKVLKSIKTLQLEDMVLGQYAGDPNGTGDAKLGYLDDKTVPAGSVTPTFAVGRFHINNERWEGVPFIVKCGKGETNYNSKIVWSVPVL